MIYKLNKTLIVTFDLILQNSKEFQQRDLYQCDMFGTKFQTYHTIYIK
ncbi:hypothetical protein pb186bvf_004425 [Paramecium bursaria]